MTHTHRSFSERHLGRRTGTLSMVCSLTTADETGEWNLWRPTRRDQVRALLRLRRRPRARALECAVAVALHSVHFEPHY